MNRIANPSVAAYRRRNFELALEHNNEPYGPADSRVFHFDDFRRLVARPPGPPAALPRWRYSLAPRRVLFVAGVALV